MPESQLKTHSLCRQPPPTLDWCQTIRLMIAILILTFLFTPAFAAPVANIYCNSPRQSSDEIIKLIDTLDSANFEARESASVELAKIGELALRPLALRSFECSPETCWRIKKTLEMICTSGNEKVFYKTTGILQVRFDSSDNAMSHRLKQLKAKWEKQRKKLAVSRLRKLGAVIDDPWEGLENNLAQIQADPFRGNLIFVNGDPVEVGANSAQTTKRIGKIKLSEPQQKKRIDKILAADLNNARKLVLGDEAKQTNKSTETATEIQTRLLLRQAMVGPGVPSSTSGVTVQIGGKWEGNPESLEDLAEISNLTSLSFKEQSLDADSLSKIAQVSSMSRLILDKCDVDSKGIKTASWAPALSEIEVANQKITTELIDSIKSIESVQSMTFRDCNFQGVGFDALEKLSNLRGLQFVDSKIPRELFRVIEKLNQLSYVVFSTCQFDTKDFKRLKQNRSSLQVSYTGKAFLGVQGPMDLTGVSPDMPCVIAQVIPGSGAAAGGMKPDDVIKSINGQKVALFEDLRLHIAQHHPGDTLNFVVDRKGKKVDLKITLTDRTPAIDIR